MALSCAAGLLLNGGRVVSTLGHAHPRIESHGRITELHLPGDDRVAEALRHREAYATGAGDATWSVADPTTGEQLLWVAQELVPWLLAATALALLRPVLTGAVRGRPFAGRAADRLQLLGWVLLLGIPALGIIRYLLMFTVLGNHGFELPAVEEDLTLSITPLLPGIAVLVLASVFRRGTELHDSDALTV
jgi:hypothetical protein